MLYLSRRRVLTATAAAGAVAAVSRLPGMPRVAQAGEEAATIRADTRVIEVHGKPAKVFSLAQPDGTKGYSGTAGDRFRVRLENRTDEDTLIHWHGLTPPWRQDGVPHLSQPPLSPGESYDYDFPLDRPGTNWMHSHLGLQEQRLMAAPLIVRDPDEAGEDVQEIVVMFHDFTFRDPDEIFAELREHGHGDGGHGHGHDGHAGHGRDGDDSHGRNNKDQGGHGAHAHGVHLHDVDYDAFLANDRTLRDPEVHRVEPGGRVRLRLINAATATNFWINLGALEGRLIAVDGRRVRPVSGHHFPFAVAQRLDLLIDLPREQGVWPVFAVREGDVGRTGIVLATRDGTIPRLEETAARAAHPYNLDLERRLQAVNPLAKRAPDKTFTVKLGERENYTWTMDGAVHGEHQPLAVREGDRVEITFVDNTTMAHPMHLHGHHFQVVAIGGERFSGAMRDTVLVPARGRVTVAFDAVNPGNWALHCHHLYHMAGGMMTTLRYEG